MRRADQPLLHGCSGLDREALSHQGVIEAAAKPCQDCGVFASQTLARLEQNVALGVALKLTP
jgi:hypothetical protein